MGVPQSRTLPLQLRLPPLRGVMETRLVGDLFPKPLPLLGQLLPEVLDLALQWLFG